MRSTHIKICWVVTEGIAGTENQCVGVAEALGLTPIVKRIGLKFPWTILGPLLPRGHGHSGLTPASDEVRPPWPDLVLASGRKSIGVARMIRKRSAGRTFVVQILDPRVAPRHFDLVVVPQHDPARGENVLVTTTGLHRVTPEKLAAAREKFAPMFGHVPRSRVAVLVGGSSRAHTMSIRSAGRLSAKLRRLVEERGAGLLVTTSRRTGADNVNLLRDRLGGPNVYFWDGTGENPYFGFLALADYIIVTEDSVSMASEALATGKPVYISPLKGGARRLDSFHKLLQEQGYTRRFTGLLEDWTYPPPDDMQRVTEEIRRRILERSCHPCKL